MIVDDGSYPANPDASLVRLLVRAHVIRERILADKSLTLEEIAKSEHIVPSYVTRLFRLTLLAPDIVSAILGGKHPPEPTARKLLDDTRLPLDCVKKATFKICATNSIPDRPILSFAFISLTINSVMASEMPVSPNCRAEKAPHSRRALPTKASLLNARHQRANEKARGCRANLRFR
ncbi:MAG: hypothetical protein WCD13_13365 [Pseudolabrys sp.]